MILRFVQAHRSAGNVIAAIVDGQAARTFYIDYCRRAYVGSVRDVSPNVVGDMAFAKTDARMTLFLAALAHLLHDGYTDMLYVLLPVWQSEFHLGYGTLATIRALNVGVLAALQVPSGQLVRRINARVVLALGTALSGIGFALAGLSHGLVSLCVCLILVGAGGSVQHPLASAAVSRAYGKQARGPLGTYNFSGDLGKATLAPASALLIRDLGWRLTLSIAAVLGILVAVLLRWRLPPTPTSYEVPVDTVLEPSRISDPKGFALLFTIGIIDTATRMGFLLFLPFLLKAKGASLTSIGLGLSLVFFGGAFGKAACGWLGARLGLLATVIATEVGTAAAIFAILLLPLTFTFAILAPLGVMLNGTSSVLYGTVPELVDEKHIEHSFALFYTGILGSSALSPMVYGRIADLTGSSWATTATALTALLVVPLMLVLGPRLKNQSNEEAI